MKRTIISLATFGLIFSNLSPIVTSANENEVITSDFNLESNVEVTQKNNTSYAVYYDGVTTYEAEYNKLTGEVYLNGRLISSEIFSDIEVSEKDFSLGSDTDNNMVSPFANEPGAGFGVTWVFQSSSVGSINLAGLSVGAVATVLASVFSKGKTITITAGLATVIASSISSSKGTVYYKWFTYTKPNKYFPSLKDRKDEIHFYKNSNYTGYITTLINQ